MSPSLGNHTGWQLTYLSINSCIHSNRHTHKSLSFHTKAKARSSHKLCAKEWLSIKERKRKNPPRSLSLPRAKYSSVGLCHMFPFEQMAARFVSNVELVKDEGLADRDQGGSLNLLSGEMVCNPLMLVNIMPL